MTDPLDANVSRRRGGRHPVPTVLQMGATECGAACLGMILAHHGRWVPLEELRVRCGISRDGSKAVSMLRAAREYGLLASGYRRDPNRMFDLRFPIIVFWRFNHFIVVEGVRGKKVYVNDPAHGPQTISWQEFDAGFTGVCLAFAPGPAFTPGGSRPSVARSLLDRLGKTLSPLSFVVLATLLLAVPGLAIPTVSKVFVDDVLIPQSGALVGALLIGLAVAALLQGALTWLQQLCLARMEIKLSLVMTSWFFRHLMTLPMAFFGQRFAGDISERVTSNDTVARLISGELATSMVNMLTMSIYAVVLFSYDAVLALVAVVMVMLNLVVLRLVSKARENGNRRMLNEHAKVIGTSVGGIQMIETLKSNGTENDFFQRWSGMHANVLNAQQQLGLMTNLLNVVPPLLSALTTIAILGLGGLRILEGSLTIGGLVAFQTLARSFFQPIEGLVQFAANLQTVKGDIARLDDVLNYEPEPRAIQAMTKPQEEAPAPARGFIEFDRVTFGYNAQEPPLIEDLSLSISPGQRVALVGRSGSGKSTLGRLVAGLLTPWSGRVLVDGMPVEEIPLDHLAGIVSYVDQEIVLFEATVHDNVTLWNPAISQRDVTEALRDAVLHEEISGRPGKFDSLVEENGRNLSGGQRQRLEIARALAPDPAVLVLDEASAALDPVTEMEIDDNLRRRGRTCLIIAHRLSTIRDADKIIVLDRGQVVQQGRHENLIVEDGLYRTLITSS